MPRRRLLRIRILGAAGYLAKTVNKTVPCPPAGAMASLVWDGRNTARAIVPAGTYFVEVTATDHAGNVGVISQSTVAVQ